MHGINTGNAYAVISFSFMENYFRAILAEQEHNECKKIYLEMALL